MKLAAAIAVLAGACAASVDREAYEELPRQAEAMALAWKGMGAPPPVEWVDGAPCSTDSPWPGLKVGGRCVAGTWDGATARVVVVPPQLGLPFSSSGLAHELMHAHLEQDYGSPDQGHLAPDWLEIPAINDRLRAEGL